MNALKTEKKWILVYLVFSLILTFLQLLNPALISRFFDNATTTNSSYLYAIVCCILIVSIITSLLNIFCSVLDVKVRNKIVLKAKSDYLGKLLSQDYSFLEKMEYGEKKTRYDMNSVYGDLAISFIAQTIIEVFTCIFIGVYLYSINHIMAIVFILCLLINSFLEYQIGKKTYKYTEEVTVLQAKSETDVENTLKNISYIKSNNCKRLVTQFVDNIQKRLAQKEELHTKEILTIENLNLQIYKIIEVFIFLLAVFMLKESKISIGQIYLFINYMGWIDNAFSTIWNNYIKFEASRAKINTIEQIFDEKDSNTKLKGMSMEKEIETLSINNVGFQYNESGFRIENINMELKKGDFIAVIGESGCGKSTLMKIISGLYCPTSGHITYNQSDITLSSPENRASIMSYVSQNITIFDGTIHDIISFLKNDCTEDEINKALQSAMLTSTINDLPEGIYTRVGESGINLSGGQLQRLALAQAIVCDKQIYLFDEITAGLDEDTQDKLINNLRTLSHDKIMIFVTHRLNTLGRFNRVFMFENGNLKEIEMNLKMKE